jgi:hypothetical protein
MVDDLVDTDSSEGERGTEKKADAEESRMGDQREAV